LERKIQIRLSFDKNYCIHLEKRTEKLESKMNQNSQNSSKPPSSDSPFKKPKKKRKKASVKKGAQNEHKGHKQELLEPTQQQNILPGKGDCGCSTIIADSLQPYYTHQVIELPKVKMVILHFILNKGKCRNCGKIIKAKVPKENQTGYRPRLSALIAEMRELQGNSRGKVRIFCKSVLKFSI
jgi:transposase